MTNKVKQTLPEGIHQLHRESSGSQDVLPLLGIALILQQRLSGSVGQSWPEWRANQLLGVHLTCQQETIAQEYSSNIFFNSCSQKNTGPSLQKRGNK